jgi:DNA-binding protein
MSTENTETDTTTSTSQPSTKSESRDVVYIGKKPLMAYVTSTLIQLANVKSVNIRARGMSISRAVDVAQIISRKTENTGYSIGNITIGSEPMESKDGKTRNVSTIEITVERK